MPSKHLPMQSYYDITNYIPMFPSVTRKVNIRIKLNFGSFIHKIEMLDLEKRFSNFVLQSTKVPFRCLRLCSLLEHVA